MLSLVGVGGAGCKIIEYFHRKDLVSSIIRKIGGGGYAKGVAIDTSDTLTSMNIIPVKNRTLIGSSRVKGHGTGGSVELGRKIMAEEAELAMNVIRRVNIEKPEVFFVVAGIGGGTGTSVPILVERIRLTYNVPIIGILLLPSRSEGALYVKNTFENFAKVADSMDGAIVLDNNVVSNRGADLMTSYKTVDEAIFNFLSMADPHYILKTTKGDISTMGFMQMRAEHTSIKEIIDQMLRDYLYLSLEGRKVGKFYLVVYGNTNEIYGQSFATNWVKERFGVEVDYLFIDEPGSKYLNIGLIITGLKDIEKEFEIKTKEEKPSSELEKLLGDIKPLF